MLRGCTALFVLLGASLASAQDVPEGDLGASLASAQDVPEGDLGATLARARELDARAEHRTASLLYEAYAIRCLTHRTAVLEPCGEAASALGRAFELARALGDVPAAERIGAAWVGHLLYAEPREAMRIGYELARMLLEAERFDAAAARFGSSRATLPMADTSDVRVNWPAGRSATTLPSRMTMMRLAVDSTSPRRWEIRMQAPPVRIDSIMTTVKAKM